MFKLLRQKYSELCLQLSEKRTRLRLRFAGIIDVVELIVRILTILAALGFLSVFTIYFGYEHTLSDYVVLRRCVRGTQAMFLLNVVFNIIFNDGLTFHGAKILSWIVNVLMLSTLLLWLYPQPESPWIPVLSILFYSRYYLFGILLIYSVMVLSYAVTAAIGCQTNPSLILSGSFLVFIALGTFLLMLPRCSVGDPMHFSDALFLSTSAICITGLTPVDISATLTPTGVLVLGILIQAGALGIITFTSFFALFFTGSSSIYNQLLLRDVIYSRSMSSLIPTLLYILIFTLSVEAIGAVLIFLSVHGTLGMNTHDELIFATFHSLSAFCNAGFSTMPGGLSNPLLLYGRQSFYWVMSFIIVAGAIGFPILVNFKDAIAGYVRRLCHRVSGRPEFERRRVHIYSMNTKIVLITFAVLFVAGTVCFWLLERENTLSGFTPGEQVTQSVFNSVTPRSAGFSSVDPAHFLSPTLLIVMFLMWVGGGSQSTAGGIKVNTLAAIVLTLRSIVTGRERITAFSRTISPQSVRRANGVVAISILSYVVYSIVILLLEPHMSVRALLFETLSALFTVGSSFGITPELSGISKLVLASAMFLGRVGLISLMSGFTSRHSSVEIRYPSDNLIIN